MEEKIYRLIYRWEGKPNTICEEFGTLKELCHRIEEGAVQAQMMYDFEIMEVNDCEEWLKLTMDNED